MIERVPGQYEKGCETKEIAWIFETS